MSNDKYYPSLIRSYFNRDFFKRKSVTILNIFSYFIEMRDLHIIHKVWNIQIEVEYVIYSEFGNSITLSQLI